MINKLTFGCLMLSSCALYSPSGFAVTCEWKGNTLPGKFIHDDRAIFSEANNNSSAVEGWVKKTLKAQGLQNLDNFSHWSISSEILRSGNVLCSRKSEGDLVHECAGGNVDVNLKIDGYYAFVESGLEKRVYSSFNIRTVVKEYTFSIFDRSPYFGFVTKMILDDSSTEIRLDAEINANSVNCFEKKSVEIPFLQNN